MQANFINHMSDNPEKSLLISIVAFFIFGFTLFCEVTQDQHFGFRIILIPIAFVVGIGNLFGYLNGSASERAGKCEGKKEAHRLEFKKYRQEVAEKIELLKQQRNEEYSQRLEIGDEIRKMPEYKNWRQEVFKKCGRKCERCCETSDIEIHHKIAFDKIIRINKIKNTYEALECVALWNINNGSVLCHQCHEKMESSEYHKNAGI